MAASRPPSRCAGGQSCGALFAHRGRIAGALGRHSRPPPPARVGHLGHQCRCTTVTAGVTSVCRYVRYARVVPSGRPCRTDVSPQARAFRAPWCAAMACSGAVPRHAAVSGEAPRSAWGGRWAVEVTVLSGPRVLMISGIRWVVGHAFARCNTRPQARLVAPRCATRRVGLRLRLAAR